MRIKYKYFDYGDTMNMLESKYYAINALREYWEIRKKEFGLNSMIFVPLANFDEIDRYLKDTADMFDDSGKYKED